MPNKPLKNCAHIGCTVLTRAKYCEQHTVKNENQSYYDKHSRDKESKSFYDSSQWQKCRGVVLQRDNYLCQCCLEKGVLTAASTVHHKKDLRLNRELALDADNLISVCNECHNTKHKRSRAHVV